MAVRGNRSSDSRVNPETGVELLIPDFSAKPSLLARGVRARPEVLAHNIETVPRCSVASGRDSAMSGHLRCYVRARDDGLVTKSNLILGLGETHDEVIGAVDDLVASGCSSSRSRSTCGRASGTTRSSAG